MSSVTLHSVYEKMYAMGYLYMLLEQRELGESISHKKMPTTVEHMNFVHSYPYLAWYTVERGDSTPVGAVYLTRQREIGVWIERKYRRHGYAKIAVAELMRQHPGRFLANINPGNLESRRLFEDMGFGLIQYTYEKE